MPVTKAPWWYLTPTPIVFGKRGGVILQNPDTASPVLEVKMFSQAVSGPPGPWAAGKGEWALRRVLQETDVKYLRNVLRLTEWKPAPANFSLRPMHMPSVRRNLTNGKLHSTVLRWDPSSQPFAVCHHPSRVPSPHRLLRHTRLECEQLACHSFEIRNIRYQSVPEEQADEHIQCALKPLRILQFHHVVFNVEES